MPRRFLPSFTSVVLLCLASEAALAQEQVARPTWETQKLARLYTLAIPAPRGQISDRTGAPLAETRVAYNLGINFPTPPDFSNSAAIGFARQQIAIAERILNRQIALSDALSDEAILHHYGNRGILPLDIASDLTPEQQAAVTKDGGDGLVLHPIYLRCYPNGALAANVLGYLQRTSKPLEGPLQNNDLLWPESIGRAGSGLEDTFNGMLTGKPGQRTYNFDARGKKVSEKVTVAPEPGYNVVTTLDLNLQKLCEKALKEGAKRGAIVFVDPNTGDVLAMASWPTFDPNLFIPSITPERYKALVDDPNIPMMDRAFHSAYPPGSTFKVFVGLAALESGAITLDQEFSGPTVIQIGNTPLHNWAKHDAGMLNFSGALEQSCNTWFAQVGIRTGSGPIVAWAQKFGFGAPTGMIQLKGENAGRVPTDEYMRKVYARKLLPGDVANLSIGQGDTLVTPLQMAEAMAAVGNGGTLFQPRVVQQVQSLDDKIVTGFNITVRPEIAMQPEILAEVKKAMISVVVGGHGTARLARVADVDVAGKTGTAQWGREKYAAWFAGFAPANQPKYAFAALYEGDPGQTPTPHGGACAAPMIGKVLRELFQTPSKSSRRSHSKSNGTDQQDEPKAAQDESVD
jgi:penicillin-binding protein 2